MHAVYVGRVGALAVALGVGTAILGFSAVAVADPGSTPGSSGDESTQSDAGRATAKTRAGSRRGAPAEKSGSAAAVAGRRTGTPRSSVTVTDGPGRDASLSPAVPQSPADLIGALLTPGGMTGLVQDAMTSLIGTIISGVPGDVLTSTEAVDLTSALQIPEMTVAEDAPVMTAQPDALSVASASSLDALGGGSGGGDPLAAPLAWAAMAVTQKESEADAATAAPAATVTTGEPVDPAATPTVDAAAGYEDFLKLPATATFGPKLDMYTWRPTIVNNLANTFATAYKLPTPGECVKNKGCPLEGSPPSVSVANTVGMYAFNVVYALAGGLKDEEIASTVQQLASQTVILDFIAQTTAAKFQDFLPPAVANLVGQAARTFVENTFGNAAGPDSKQANFVALKFVPFLKALNIPTSDPAFGLFLDGCKTDASRAILKRFDVPQRIKGRDALISFFNDSGVQGYFSSAFTSSINIMLAPAFANYLGGNAATAILGEGNTNIPALSDTIGNAIETLFASPTGGIVATQAGKAFGTTFLSQEKVPTYLANAMVNDLVSFLSPGPPAPDPVLPFPQAELRILIAPSAGVATTSFVNSLFTPPNLQPVSQDLGAFITTLIPGILANPGVQQKLGDEAATAVTTYLHDYAFAQAVGTQVGIAVSNLVANPDVQTGLTTWVNALGANILGSSNAVTAIATAAGDWVTADLIDPKDEKAKQAIATSLRTNAAIDAAVGQSVTAGVTALFKDDEVLSAINSTAISLITTLLGNAEVQAGLGAQVSSEVAKLFINNQALGQAVGAQAGAAVVGFLGNPTIRTELVNLVDTMATDFFKTPGVVDAFATMAGAVATANLAEDPDAAKAATATFKANANVQKGVSVAVGGAVRTLFTNSDVLTALDNAAGSFVSGLLTSPDVRTGISVAVATDVSKLLGGGPLGDAVGAQVGSAVAGLLSEQSVQKALAGLVDTELGDFFAAPGVVDAFAAAADTFVLYTLAGESGAGTAAVKSLRDSTSVQDAVGNIVTTSVFELLTDSTLWSTFDDTASTLLARVLADPTVQEGVSERVYTAVWTAFNGTALGVAVGDQAAAAVVDLMRNPAISDGLVGVVDTVFSDFFGYPGVDTAFADAAGELAAAAVKGDLKAAEAKVQTELRGNVNVQQGINKAVGDAVTTLLTTPNFVGALNDKVASLASGLLGDPAVQAAIQAEVAKEVSSLFRDVDLGQVVGDQVGTAVVEIVSNPVVSDALAGLVDTELGDFFRADGVVAAFAAAADTFALDLVTGSDFAAAATAAEEQLRTNTSVDNAVQNIVTAAVADLLGNTKVWQAVDGTTSRLVADLLADSEVQNAVADQVYLAVWNAFNQTFLGVAVGDQVAAAVVSLMKNPAVDLALVELVDTVSVDFFGYPGVVQAFSAAAGELASAAVQGPEQFKAALLVVQEELRQNTDVDQAIGVAVGDAVEALLTDPDALAAVDDTAAALVNGLLTDTTVQAALSAQIAVDVSKWLGVGDLGESVGAEVGPAVVGFLSDPTVREALVGLFDSELGDFFNSPGVVAAFVEASNMFAVSVVTGESVKTASSEAIGWLRADAAVDDAIQGIVSNGVGNLLGNTNVIRTFDNDLATLLSDLEPYAGQIVSLLVTRSLSPELIAAPVGQAIGDAVAQLLTVPGFGSGVLTIITSIPQEFLGQFGVPTAIGGIAGQYVASVVAGVDPKDAEQEAIAALEESPTIDSAAKETIADSLILADLNLLSNPTIQQALGATVATLINTLAAEPAIQAIFAPPLAELMSNAEVVGQVAAAVGSAVTQLLAYPGFNPALLGAVNQYADAVIDGTDAATAQGDALTALRSTPEVVGAVNYVIPTAVNSLLGYPDVLAALGLYADETTVASLQKNRFNIGFLDPTIGKVVDGTVESLLVKQAGVILADNLAVNLVLGMPWQDWRKFTTQEIIADPFLQIAVGMSIGQGVGSLLGDNIVADLVGVAVGVPAALAVGIGAGIAGILQWLFGKTTYGVSPAASTSQTSTGGKHRLREDLYVTNTVILSPVAAAS